MMNENEQTHDATEQNDETTDVYRVEETDYDDQHGHDADEYDYNREPPLDSATVSSNRQRSKYVFMTLCFLLALLFLYTYISNPDLSSNWFPLAGAIVLTVMGIIFLRSPDSPPATQLPTEKDAVPDGENPVQSSTETLGAFEKMVQEALATLPEEFRAQIENVMVRVAYEPDEETRTRVGIKEGYTLLGLYEGVPLTVYGRQHAPYPEMITIYQRSIEDYCHHDPARIRDQVRATVLHEIAHHFGMEHEEMPIWVK